MSSSKGNESRKGCYSEKSGMKGECLILNINKVLKVAGYHACQKEKMLTHQYSYDQNMTDKHIFVTLRCA